MRAIKSRLGIILQTTDAHGDTITAVTKKSADQQGTWTLIGDIRDRFSSARAAKAAYNKQRKQHNNKHTRTERLLTYNGQVCPTLIQSGHTNEESHDASLHTVYASSHIFWGRDGTSLHKLFRDSLLAHYEALLGGVHADYLDPNDFYTSINDAMDFARDNPTLELYSLELLYLFELYRCTKTGGTSSPYICLEWPCIQIPHTITSLLLDKGLNFLFINDSGAWEQHTIHFYEQNY
jgi:hypothetical protein